jgi:hypothetical protein
MTLGAVASAAFTEGANLVGELSLSAQAFTGPVVVVQGGAHHHRHRDVQ